MGRDSVDVIATRYGLDGPRIEYRWGARFATPVQTSPGAHPASYTIGTGSFPGLKAAGGRADRPPHLGPGLREGYSCNSTPPLGLRGPFQGELYIFIGCNNYHKFLHAKLHRRIYCTTHGLNLYDIAVMSSEIFEFILRNYDLRKVLSLVHTHFAAIPKPENHIILRMSHRKPSLRGTYHPVLGTASTLRNEV